MRCVYCAHRPVNYLKRITVYPLCFLHYRELGVHEALASILFKDDAKIYRELLKDKMESKLCSIEGMRYYCEDASKSEAISNKYAQIDILIHLLKMTYVDN